MKTKKKPAKLKLYVWENVLTDWTSGIIFALARSPEHARKVVLKGAEDYMHKRLSHEMAAEPDVYSSPIGFTLSGGS